MPRAYELGRDMFEQGLGVLDAVGVHYRAVRAMAANGMVDFGESLIRAGEVTELLGDTAIDVAKKDWARPSVWNVRT